jgi:predicted YcjX-like family ATPase
MKNLILILSVNALAILGSPLNGFAASQTDLANYFEQHISEFDQQLSALDETEAVQTQAPPTMALSDINVQLSTFASFGINSVLSISISPEIDFIVTPAASTIASATNP